MKSKTNNRRNAFTLLEVLLATAIMGIIALMLYSSLYIAVKAKKSSVEAITPYNNVAAVFEFMRKDIECAVTPGGVLAGDFAGVDQSGTEAEDCDTISFFTTSARTNDEQSGSNIIKVQYVLEADLDTEKEIDLIEESGQLVLKRNTTKNLLAPTTAEAATEIIARDISGINLRYYDGSEWVEQWDSNQNDDSLPQAVEISLMVDKAATVVEEEQTVTYTKIIILDCYKPAQTQTDAAE